MPSKMANAPPTLKSNRATTNGQKYRSLARPNGKRSLGGRVARRIPTRSSAWLPVSASECTASASVAVECERPAAANLHAAIATLPASAAKTTLRLLAWDMGAGERERENRKTG